MNQVDQWKNIIEAVIAVLITLATIAIEFIKLVINLIIGLFK